jgi:anthranilate synthase component 2
MILVLDNYDSFTYNLVQYIGELGANPIVFRNDAITPKDIRARSPKAIIISPGPGTPEDAGVSIAVVKELSGEIPILGVCLGHQSIGAAFGARICRTTPLHGKASVVQHESQSIYEGVPNPFLAGRYHSLVVAREELPAELVVTATTDDGTIMGIRHCEHQTHGVQFHPESILTGDGKVLLGNFLRVVGEVNGEP